MAVGATGAAGLRLMPAGLLENAAAFALFRNVRDRPRGREAASYIRDYRNRLSLDLTYRTQYSVGNFACIPHPQDNNPV